MYDCVFCILGYEGGVESGIDCVRLSIVHALYNANYFVHLNRMRGVCQK